MRVAYADPPYLGASRKHYPDHPEHAVYDTHEGQVALIDRLVAEFPDGWALSMASVNLYPLLRHCPPDVRVMAWVKPFAIFKPNVNPGYCWEPVIVRGGRQKRDRSEATVRDWVSANVTLKRGVAGAKPAAFCYWLFEVLGLRRGDDFVDLFLGSGAVQLAWKEWQDGWLAA